MNDEKNVYQGSIITDPDEEGKVQVLVHLPTGGKEFDKVRVEWAFNAGSESAPGELGPRPMAGDRVLIRVVNGEPPLVVGIIGVNARSPGAVEPLAPRSVPQEAVEAPVRKNYVDDLLAADPRSLSEHQVQMRQMLAQERIAASLERLVSMADKLVDDYRRQGRL